MSTQCSCVDALRCCICDGHISLKHRKLVTFMHLENGVIHLYCDRCDVCEQMALDEEVDD